MALIREIAQKAIATGKLTVNHEKELRLQLKGEHTREDLEAFMRLQQAVIRGQVTQQSRKIAG